MFRFPWFSNFNQNKLKKNLLVVIDYIPWIWIWQSWALFANFMSGTQLSLQKLYILDTQPIISTWNKVRFFNRWLHPIECLFISSLLKMRIFSQRLRHLDVKFACPLDWEAIGNRGDAGPSAFLTRFHQSSLETWLSCFNHLDFDLVPVNPVH